MGYTGMTGESVLVSDNNSDNIYFIYSFSALFFIAFILILIVDKEIQFRNNRKNFVSYCDESAKNRVIQIKL